MKNRTIILRMTNKCNLNCTYCYDKKNKLKNEIEIENNIENVIKYILKLNKDKNTTQKIILHGGEPLIVPIKVYENFLDKLLLQLPKCRFSIQTNATLITEKHIKFFNKYNIHVGISLDGCNKEQNSCRIYKNGNSTFERVIKSMQILKSNSIKFGVIITLTKKHIGQEKNIYEFIKYNHIKCSIRPAFPVKDLDNSLILSPQEYYEILKNLFNIWYDDESNEINLTQIIDIADELFKVLEPEYRVNCCSDCKNCFKNFISLDIAGNLYTCNRNYNINQFYYGNINDITVEELNKKIDDIFKKRLNFLLKSKCKNCQIYEYCYGGCPSSSYNLHGTYMAPEDYFCEAKIKIREYIKNRLEKNGDLKYYNENKRKN